MDIKTELSRGPKPRTKADEAEDMAWKAAVAIAWGYYAPGRLDRVMEAIDE